MVFAKLGERVSNDLGLDRIQAECGKGVGETLFDAQGGGGQHEGRQRLPEVSQVIAYRHGSPLQLPSPHSITELNVTDAYPLFGISGAQHIANDLQSRPSQLSGSGYLVFQPAPPVSTEQLVVFRDCDGVEGFGDFDKCLTESLPGLSDWLVCSPSGVDPGSDPVGHRILGGLFSENTGAIPQVMHERRTKGPNRLPCCIGSSAQALDVLGSQRRSRGSCQPVGRSPTTDRIPQCRAQGEERLVVHLLCESVGGRVLQIVRLVHD